MKRKLDIIWNISLICPWDCDICCVDAVHVTQKQNKVILKSNRFGTTYEKNKDQTIFTQAARIRQKQGLELIHEKKLNVIDNLSGHDVKINFSGGDPLVVFENIEILRKASQQFGKENIQISTTGAGLSMNNPSNIIPFIDKIRFTYDTKEGVYNPNRPNGYNNFNLQKASEYRNMGIFTIAEIPLTIHNSEISNITLLYEDLHKAGIDQILLMRLFPVGRGSNIVLEMPSKKQYLRSIETFRKLESKYRKPRVKIQCALKYLYKTNSNINPCDSFRESFAITSNGLLITSAWAFKFDGQPLDDAFILGDIAKNHIDILLNSPRAKYYKNNMDDNFGHCKVFAYLNSDRDENLQKLFDKTDPLYI